MPSRMWNVVRLMPVVACALVLAASPASAHEGHMDPAKYLSFLDKKLQLTPDQHARVEQIVTEYHRRAESLKQQLEDLHKEKHQSIKAVLTPEQQEKFEKLNKQHGWHERRHDEKPQ